MWKPERYMKGMSPVSVVMEDVRNKEWINPLLGPRDKVIEKSDGLIRKTAAIWWVRVRKTRALEFDDLYQEAAYGFLQAYYKYNHTKVAFNTFATYTASRYVERYVDFKIGIVHIPVLKRKRERLPFIKLNSLNKPVMINGESKTEELIDYIESDPFDPTVVEVEQFISGLNLKEQTILRMIMNEYTYQEAGAVFGMTRQAAKHTMSTIRGKYLFYKKHGRHKRRGEKE